MIIAQMPMASTSYGIKICMSLSYYTNNYARRISNAVSYNVISYLVFKYKTGLSRPIRKTVNHIIDVYQNMYPLNISNRYDVLYIFGKAIYRNCSNSLVTTQFIYTKDPPNEIVLCGKIGTQSISFIALGIDLLLRSLCDN